MLSRLVLIICMSAVFLSADDIWAQAEATEIHTGHDKFDGKVDLVERNGYDLIPLNDNQRLDKPPLRSDKIIGEVLLGAAGEVLLAGPIVVLAYVSESDNIGYLIGYVIAVPLGSTLGVYAIGTAGNE